jgi:hypothetical protein
MTPGQKLPLGHELGEAQVYWIHTEDMALPNRSIPAAWTAHRYKGLSNLRKTVSVALGQTNTYREEHEFTNIWVGSGSHQYVRFADIRKRVRVATEEEVEAILKAEQEYKEAANRFRLLCAPHRQVLEGVKL